MILSKSGFVRPFQKKEFYAQPLPEMIIFEFSIFDNGEIGVW